MTALHFDYETYCDLDLKKVGVYRYVSHPSFCVLWLSYRFDDQPVRRVDLMAQPLPPQVRRALTDPTVIKYAHNAPFEFVVTRAAYKLDGMDWSQWRCTQVQAAYLGLPHSLEKVASVLKLANQKDGAGKTLMSYWSKPCTPRKSNGMRTRNLPEHHPEKWAAYGDYCVQDTVVESDISAYAARFPDLPPVEWTYWAMDQRINDRGVHIDREFVLQAIALNSAYQAEVYAEMFEICGIDSPRKLDALKKWIKAESGVTITKLDKEFYKDFVPEEWPPHVARVFELRKLASRASIAKYDAMIRFATADDRVRGILQFYGAGRTGREAGRAVQPQNMPKNKDNAGRIKQLSKEHGVAEHVIERLIGVSLDTAREAVRKGLAEVLYDDVPALVSELIRTAITAPEGRMLAVCDFSAIEARVVSWLAGEDWQLEVFRGDGKIYEATASRMFNVAIELITKSSPLRAKGKVASLALGYQGGEGALITMGALREGLLLEELDPIKDAWRAANPNIVKLWKLVNNAAKYVIEKRTAYTLRLKYTALRFSYEKGNLFITLPSGRRLAYHNASLRAGRKGMRIVYWGLNDKKQWVMLDTYGGKLVENITQAIARDCLFDSMLRMDQQGIEIIMHVHDEMVAECDKGTERQTLKLMEDIMAVSPLWAKDLPLRGDGFVSPIYRKD